MRSAVDSFILGLIPGAGERRWNNKWSVIADLFGLRTRADAQHYVQERALDLEGVCHADEFGYWTAAPSKGGRRR
jgi:hypothetical protein